MHNRPLLYRMCALFHKRRGVLVGDRVKAYIKNESHCAPNSGNEGM